MWLFQSFVRKSKKEALSSMLTTKVDRRKPKDGQLNSYTEVINYFLKTYATEEVIVEAVAAIKQFLQSSLMSPPGSS